jgi:Family of unknown function (DUF5706)
MELPAEDLKEGVSQGEPEKKKKDKQKSKKTERGVETMFRVTADNLMRLSDMADNKAHILLTINSIIVSVLVSLVLRTLDEHQEYLMPAILFLSTSLVTVVFAILVTMPNITHGTFTPDDIRNKKANLMFFGNYHNMSQQDYEWGITSMMKDPEFLYGGMIRDNYNLGVLLEKKYRKLRIAYAVFMFGFVVSVISFLLADWIY